MIVFLTKDLFFIPVLQSAGAKQGVQVASIMALDSTKTETLDHAAVTTCVIDLACVEAMELQGLAASLRAKFPATRLAAFGPHVQVDKLDAATAVGVEQVLTRGQLTKHIDRLIADWAQ